MNTDDQMLRQLRAEVGALRVAVIAILEKSSPEVRSEFARRISSALDWNERTAGNPDAALMTEAAANLIVRVMPAFRAQMADGAPICASERWAKARVTGRKDAMLMLPREWLAEKSEELRDERAPRAHRHPSGA